MGKATVGWGEEHIPRRPRPGSSVPPEAEELLVGGDWRDDLFLRSLALKELAQMERIEQGIGGLQGPAQERALVERWRLFRVAQ